MLCFLSTSSEMVSLLKSINSFCATCVLFACQMSKHRNLGNFHVKEISVQFLCKSFFVQYKKVTRFQILAKCVRTGAGRFVTAISSPLFRCGYTLSPASSSRVHFVTSCFVAETLRRQPFHRGDTSSPAVSPRRHFVASRFITGTLRHLPFSRCDTSSLECKEDGGVRLSSKTT